jgi:archaeosine synthase beta-subunit
MTVANRMDRSLKARLNRTVAQYRRGFSETVVSRRRSWDDAYVEDGRPYRRRGIILSAGRCSMPTCTMCPFPNFGSTGTALPPIDELSRHVSAHPLDGVDVLAIYNDGSFFADHELSADARTDIAHLVARTGVNHVMVESLPQFITEETVRPFVEALDGKKVTIGIGLQSANHIVREYCVNSTFSGDEFESSVSVASKHGCKVKAYVLMKPPFLTDTEALVDAENSARYVGALDSVSLTLCPVRVAPGTLLAQLARSGLYEPLTLEAVMATLRACLAITPCRIAAVNLTGGDFPCTLSTSRNEFGLAITNAIVAFARTGDEADLRLAPEIELAIEQWTTSLEHAPSTPLERRVRWTLDELEERQRDVLDAE